MSSARDLLTVTGQVVGSAFGPIGSAVGGYIGGQIGGAIDGPVRNTQALINELGAIKIDYGTSWPRIYGGYPFAVVPNLWSSTKRAIQHDEEVDAKGGPAAINTHYTYEQDWMCAAPLGSRGFARVWVNGELKFNVGEDADADTIRASAATDAWGSITFRDGAADQMPWSVYEAAVGTANAIAYRHRPALCIESLNLGPSGQPPLIKVEFTTWEVPTPVEPMFVSAAGGENGQPMPNAGDVEAGDAIILLTNHYGAGADLTPPAGYTDIFSFSDSAGVTRTHVMGRVADGTATDAQIACGIEGGLAAGFVVVILRGMVTEGFPAYLAPSCISGVNGLNPALVQDQPDADSYFNLACGHVWSGNTHLGPELSITAPPTGYETAASVGFAVNANEVLSMSVAWSESSDDIEDPGPFDRSTGNASVSEGVILLRVPALSFAGATPVYPDLADIVRAEALLDWEDIDEFRPSDCDPEPCPRGGGLGGVHGGQETDRPGGGQDSTDPGRRARGSGQHGGAESDSKRPPSKAVTVH